MFERILLAVDGSEHGLRAARLAGDLARAVNAGQLRVVVAYEPVPKYVTEPSLSQAKAARTAEAQRILQEAREAIGSLPAEVSPEVVEGSIAEAIVEVARARNSDVVVMGSRGYGRLEGALLGSNSQKVVNHAPCPVLIVR